MKKPSLLIIFLTVFLDLIGFGIVLPLLPIYSERFGASGFMIGLIIASYSIMQVIFSPFWGRWSDRVGRRPILLISLMTSTISYAIFALGAGIGGRTGLLILLASRVFAGIGGANVTVAQAYIADITPPEQRSKRMGLIGMAFGLGFVLGPAIGGLSAGFGESAPGWVAAFFCGANFLTACLILPESRKSDSPPAKPRQHLELWSHTFRTPGVGLLILLFFVSTFCFTCFETTIGLLIIDTFHLDHESAMKYAAFLFAYCGLIGAFVQGGMIGRLIKMFGEQKLIGISLGLVALSMFMLPYSTTLFILMVTLTILSVGTSAVRPPVFGLISNLTPENEQGATLGVAQSTSSFARCVGPIFAGILFKMKPAIPYLICAGILALATVVAFASVAKFTPKLSPVQES